MVKQSFNTQATELAALRFATTAHEGQVRKFDLPGEKRPYIVHPEEVAHRAYCLGLTSPAIQAAWLHDTIEDCDVTYREILEQFGVEVADLVWGLTNVDARVPDHRLENRKARKAADVDFLRRQDVTVRMLKFIDLGVNMEDTPERESFADLFMLEADVLSAALLLHGGIWPDVLAFYLRARRDLGNRRLAWKANHPR